MMGVFGKIVNGGKLLTLFDSLICLMNVIMTLNNVYKSFQL